MINTFITSRYYGNYWKGKRNRTESSYSVLHFGCCKKASRDDILRKIQGARVLFGVKVGTTLRRWCKFLLVMLDHIPRVKVVENIRSILLIRADLNALSKLLIGVHVVRATEKSVLITLDQYSGWKGLAKIIQE